MVRQSARIESLSVVLAACLASFWLSGVASADPERDSSASSGRPNDVALMESLHRLAEEGDANAQFMLGALYFTGEGVPQDYEEALKWYRRSAEQGHASAQHDLGVTYYQGKFVTQDYVEAFKWFQKSADHGHAKTQYNLGRMYYEGKGVPQDYAEALRWYRRSAEQGNAKAQYSLGMMYASGQVVTADLVQAHLWFNLAGSRASDPKTREAATGNRDSVAAMMTSAQIAEAQRLAREWKPVIEEAK